MFMPFAGRTPTDDLDICQRQIAIGNHIYVLKTRTVRRLIARLARDDAEAIAAVPESEPRVTLATGSYIGEGFYDARLDTLFLATPISWKGTLQQYVGRLHRLHDAKRVVRVYDYVDSRVPMLARMYARRLKGYGAIGYRIGTAAVDEPSFGLLNDLM